jgi:hypothetical protein
MFFLIRYHTVVASRRLINFARQLFSRVTLVRMTASSFARHFLQAGVFITCCAAKFQRGIKIIRCQVGVLEEKKVLPSGLRVVPTPAPTAPFRNEFDVLATTPCRGLSLSR